jgi:hypothetical protein
MRINVETTEGQGSPAGRISGLDIDQMETIKTEMVEPIFFLII